MQMNDVYQFSRSIEITNIRSGVVSTCLNDAVNTCWIQSLLERQDV